MKKVGVVAMMIVAGISSFGGDEYGDLIRIVINACDNPQNLLTTAFTNDVTSYRTVCTNLQGQSTIDLALAISLMHRMDHDDECVANDGCFRWHQGLVSNIVYNSGLGEASWIRSAAAVEYMTGLNYGNQQDAAFSLATNMVERGVANPPDMGVTNFWSSMAKLMRCPNEDIMTVFRLNAATWLALHNRMEEIVPLTNSLPQSAVNVFLEEMR